MDLVHFHSDPSICFITFSPIFHSDYMTCPFKPPRFNNPDNVRLLVMNLPPFLSLLDPNVFLKILISESELMFFPQNGIAFTPKTVIMS